MTKLWIILFSLSSLLFVEEKKTEKNFIRNLLEADTSSIVKEVYQNAAKYRLQIIYTNISRDKKNNIILNTYSFRTDSNEYFYPASMAKLPVSALTLEKIHKLNLNSVPFDSLFLKTIDRDKPYYSSAGRISELLMKMFVVSSNNAFNDLYDFLGQEYINQRLWEMGYKQARIIQKFLSTDSIGHRTSLPVEVCASDGNILYQRGIEINSHQLKNEAEKTLVGEAYYDDKKLVKHPKDFSYSNYIPLQDLHKMLISLIYPDQVAAQQRFNLTEEDYQILRKYMKMYPRETGVDEWKDENIYYDSFRKYLMVGTTKSRLDSCMRIYNKVGQAYGFMTDCAYIVDYSKDIEFFLSSTIYVNDDGIINDGRYEYESKGFPFLVRIGELFYNHELTRARKILSRQK